MDHRQGVRDGRHTRCHGLRDAADEILEEEGRVCGTAASLGVELHGEPRPHAMDDALVGPVVCVDHQRHPVTRQRVAVHCETVVLGRDVAACRAKVNARLVHAAVAKLHLVSLRACSKRQDLVPEANAKDRCGRPSLHDCAHMLYRLQALQGVARPVAQEQTIEGVLREVVVPWYHGDLDTQHVHKVADDVILDAAVHGQDVYEVASRLSLHSLVRCRTGCVSRAVRQLTQRWWQEDLRLPSRDLRGEVQGVRVLEL
mmetsp:Transcript_16240/g.51019  ORF Transcript_16240/g.51019 Transcript_16240/m.51019 type:complete len:257 (-) Transcript_16240:634-1404(-)